MTRTMPKIRGRKNRDLPANLYYTRRKDGRLYYEYRRPTDGKRIGFGYDRREAIAAALEANAILASRSSLVGRAAGSAGRMTLGQYIDRYRDEILPQRRVRGLPLSKTYLAETGRILARIGDGLGRSRPLAEIRQGEIAAYLRNIESAEASNQHRIRLIQLWKHAVSDEIVPANLPERVVARDKSRRKRRRLTLEQYQAIFAEARPAIRNAMELSLNALQRRGDIQKWRFSDQGEGYAHVIQSKTRKYGPSAWLRIPLELPVSHSENGSRTLGDVISACRDDVICPFLIHERPQRQRRVDTKEHQFQLTATAITRGFAAAREAAGIGAGEAPEERPTFHELLALGEHLREKQGWDREQIRSLRGHTSLATTEHYLDGHEWTVVSIPRGQGV